MSTTKFGPPSGPSKPSHAKSKFLPFITEKSSPLIIFKTLIQRTKGLSNQDLCTLYSAILCVGINAIQEKVKKSPDTLTTKQIFTMLTTSYPQYRPSVYKLKFWEHVLAIHGYNNLKTNTDYSREEITVLFTCLAEYKKDALQDLDFNCSTEYLELFSKEDYSHDLSKTPDLIFTNQNNRIGFQSLTELKAYIAYKLAVNGSASFYPVSIKDMSEYSKKECVPVYKREKEEDDVPF